MKINDTNIRFIHGVEIGLCYKYGNSGVELSWTNLSRDISLLRYFSENDSFSERNYDVVLGGYGLGWNHQIGNWGLHSSLYLNQLKIERQIGNNALKIVRDRQWMAQLGVDWYVQQSTSVSVVIRPYYLFSLQDFEITPLASDLGLSGIDIGESPHLFGIAILFYNGRQD